MIMFTGWNYEYLMCLFYLKFYTFSKYSKWPHFILKQNYWVFNVKNFSDWKVTYYIQQA